MKKSILAILSTFACTVAALPVAAATHANAQTAETDKLVSPVSYEEYLPLSAPSDTAANGGYTAVADGNLIYIYDRAEERYTLFTHTVQGTVSDTVKQLQFAADGKLYFSDNSSGDNFYALELDGLTQTKINAIACSTFVIDGLDMYFANSTGALYYTDLSDYDSEKSALPIPEPSKPALAFWNNELYFTDSGVSNDLYKISPGSSKPTRIATFDDQIQDVAIVSDVFACTTVKGELFTYPLPSISNADRTAYTHETGGYTALASFGEYLYAVKNNTVRQYSVTALAFTPFEVCSHSAAPNRLDGATETVLYKDKLYIADNGNARISVYNTQEKTFETSVPTNGDILYLAASEATLLAANANGAILYDLSDSSYGAELFSFADPQGNVVGVAEVYGTYYLVTDEKQFYTLSYADEWSLSEPVSKTIPTPKALASDAYSNLYVLTEQTVYKYAEDEISDGNVEGEKLEVFIPVSPSKIAVDYKRSVYALANDRIYDLTNGGETEFSTPLVYTDTVSVTSFAFGIETQETFVLCDGNYILSTTRLDLPTVQTVPTDGSDEWVFAEESATFELVRVQENALLVDFDIAKLNGSEYFPFLKTERADEPVTAVKIGETEEYALLTVFDPTANEYSTCVTLKEYCEALPSADYRVEYADAEQRTGYITNDIALFKFPYLTNLLKSADMPQGGEVTLLGEIVGPNHDYYYISYQTTEGETRTGYVPQAYVSPYDGLPPESETHDFGATESNSDAEWRFAYLVLGFAAICILVDYLILKKYPKE